MFNHSKIRLGKSRRMQFIQTSTFLDRFMRVWGEATGAHSTWENTANHGFLGSVFQFFAVCAHAVDFTYFRNFWGPTQKACEIRKIHSNKKPRPLMPSAKSNDSIYGTEEVMLMSNFQVQEKVVNGFNGVLAIIHY